MFTDLQLLGVILVLDDLHLHLIAQTERTVMRVGERGNTLLR